MAFAIDCHDREVPAYVASPRPLTGADIRTLMDRTLWARFGEAVLKVPHAIQWLSDNGPQYTATATVLSSAIISATLIFARRRDSARQSRWMGR